MSRPRGSLRLLALAVAAALSAPAVSGGQAPATGQPAGPGQPPGESRPDTSGQPSDAGAPAAPRTALKILTGPQGSTYHAMAKDLERLMAEVVTSLNVDLDVVPSPGGPQHVIEVFTDNSIPLALAQLDLVAYVRAFSKPEDRSRHVADGIRWVLPLDDEELHVIARRPASRLADLAGKRVSIGEPDSGTAMTARLLLRLSRVEPREILNLEFPRAVEGLRRGEVDAVMLVTGVPSPELRQHVTAADRFHFVPVALGAAVALEDTVRAYAKGAIPAGVYPGQGQEVETVTVRSGIATAGPVSCQAVGRLARAAVDHLPWLRDHGHTKWKNISFDPVEILAQPRLSPCAARALR